MQLPRQPALYFLTGFLLTLGLAWLKNHGEEGDHDHDEDNRQHQRGARQRSGDSHQPAHWPERLA